MTIKLTAVYNERSDGKWDAHISESPHITLYKAEDLATAQVFLPIITAEEVSYVHGVRARWEIEKEEINYFNYRGY